MLKIIMTTYAPDIIRAGYSREVVRSLYKNLATSLPADWEILIADDGTPDEIFNVYYAETAFNLKYTRVMRKGIGGSLNCALREVRLDDLIMYITDDWVLTETLNIQPAIDLITQLGYDYVRVNPLHPNLVCTTKFHQPIGWWLDLHQSQGGFAFATRPFIASRRFFEKVGEFKEYADAYVTEQDYAERVAHMSALKLAALVDMHGPWRHIGDGSPVGKIQLNAPVSDA